MDIAFASSLTLAFFGCHSQETSAIPRAASQAPKDVDSIVRFCADCHAIPQGASFAKARWQEEVEQGIRIYRQSSRNDLVVPDLAATVAYFQASAPDELVIQPPKRIEDKQFKEKTIVWPNERKPVSISSIRAQHLSGERPEFLLTDMWTGAISYVFATDGGMTVNEVGAVAHPAHIEPLGASVDHGQDYIVADLGTLNPQSEKQGSVWMIRDRGKQPAKQQAVKLGMSRVADVRPIDHDNDGDLDLLVADFGLHFVGSIFLGVNESSIDEMPRYQWEVLDPRPGAISIPTIDFDQDGHMDFVALIAQHFETVELNMNQGGGRFDTKVIYEANDPSFGTSSMELVDFDKDGDTDVLYTNGDTFDDTLAKPYHGIKWLENKGVFPFTVHEVAAMPGCYKAVSGDVDLDGDMDIAAVAYLSNEEVAKYSPDTFDGVAWFEQQTDGSFIRHTMLKNKCQSATCAFADWDLDGDLDLVVPPSTAHHEPSAGLTVFFNQTSSKSASEMR